MSTPLRRRLVVPSAGGVAGATQGDEDVAPPWSVHRAQREELTTAPEPGAALKIGFGIVILASLAAVNWSLSNFTSIYQIFRAVTSSD